MFERVISALNAVHLTDKYQSKFMREQMTDELVLQSIDDPSALITVIPTSGHRVKFLEAFKNSQQQKVEQVDPSVPADGTSNPLASNSKSGGGGVVIKAEKASAAASSSSPSDQSTDFTTMLDATYEKSIQFYTDNMNELVGTPGIFFDHDPLYKKHEGIKSQAMDTFFLQCKEHKKSISQGGKKNRDEKSPKSSASAEMSKGNDQNFHLKVKELNQHLDQKFAEYKHKDEHNIRIYISNARKFMETAKKIYISKMNEYLSICSDEETLREKEIKVNEEALKYLNESIRNPYADSGFIKQLNGEFQQSMKIWVDSNLESFQLKCEKTGVSRAFEHAKLFYSKEMEKEFNSQKFIQPEELLKIDKIISEAALKTFEEKTANLKLNSTQKEQLLDAIKIVYKSYEEKNLLRRPKSSPAIGIDLGTTYSSVAVYVNGKVEVIPNENGNKMTPSFVCFQDDGSVLVGDDAKEKSSQNPQNTIFDAKRLIGRRFSDGKVQENVNIKFWPFQVVQVVKEGTAAKARIQDSPRDSTQKKSGETEKMFKTYGFEEISALVLKKMKNIAEQYLGVEVKDAVISVPAFFTDHQRQLTRCAGEIAGLNVLSIINEPTAAAISYKLHRTDEPKRNVNVLVFDLGGGKLDVAILQIAKGEINVKSVHGDAHLGGQDFDTQMVKYCIDSFKQKHGIDLARRRDSDVEEEKVDAFSRLRKIRNECEKQKIILSSATTAIVGINGIENTPELLNLQVRFSREKFESLNQKNFSRCLEIIQLALDEAKMSKNVIDEIILVGGSTRIPRIQQMLSDFFGKSPCKSINPDEAVAEGAAIQARILSRKRVSGKNILNVQDVNPFSVGIKIPGGEMLVLIPKNSPLPCSRTKILGIKDDAQPSVGFSFYEGEDPVAQNNNFWRTIWLDDIPQSGAGKANVEIEVNIAEDGTLAIKVVYRDSGTNQVTGTGTPKLFSARMTKNEIEAAKARFPSVR